jgi:hypothetical protein
MPGAAASSVDHSCGSTPRPTRWSTTWDGAYRPRGSLTIRAAQWPVATLAAGRSFRAISIWPTGAGQLGHAATMDRHTQCPRYSPPGAHISHSELTAFAACPKVGNFIRVQRTIRRSVAHNENAAPTTFLIMIAPTVFSRDGGILHPWLGEIAWPCPVRSKWYRYC